MANILVHKIGSGQPGNNKLATGEFGVDIEKKVLWVGTDTGEAVELSGGEIKWEQIIDVPGAIDIIINPDNPDYISLDDLQTQVNNNSTAIGDLQDELARIEGKVDANRSLIDQNISDIKDNADLLDSHSSTLSAHGAQIQANKILSEKNEGGVADNLAEIEKLKLALDGSLTGLTYGGEYDATNNLVKEPSTEGKEAGLVHNEALPATEFTKGLYVIVTTAGVLDGTGIKPESDGTKTDESMAYKGDWLVSDGVHGWVHLEFHTEQTLWGTIGGEIANQDDLQAQFATKVGVDDTIGGGNYNL
jgi:hypothetical protein